MTINLRNVPEDVRSIIIESILSTTNTQKVYELIRRGNRYDEHIEKINTLEDKIEKMSIEVREYLIARERKIIAEDNLKDIIEFI